MVIVYSFLDIEFCYLYFSYLSRSRGRKQTSIRIHYYQDYCNGSSESTLKEYNHHLSGQNIYEFIRVYVL